MMKKFISFLIIIFPIFSFAQEGKTEKKGTPIVRVFSNFYTGFGAENDVRGFYLDRSYLGYDYKLTKELSVRGVLDIGKSNDVDDYQRIAYIKNAFITWKRDKFTLNGGLIPTTQFNFQERFWANRYIMKSFQDEYKFGSSADLGLSVSYKFTDWFSADAIVVNGEGYKKIQKFDGLNYGLGMTLNPFRNFYLRLYGGINEAGVSEKKDMVNMAAFVGYKCERFMIGAEYNHLLNATYQKNADQYGYSIYGSLKLNKFSNLFARFDDIYSKNDWNIDNDKQVILAGAEFKLCKYVKLAPNTRIVLPKGNETKTACYAYINCYFGI